MTTNDDLDDFTVWSDDLYGDADGDSIAELPVSRLPDGRSAALLRSSIAAEPTLTPLSSVSQLARQSTRGSARQHQHLMEWLLVIAVLLIMLSLAVIALTVWAACGTPTLDPDGRLTAITLGGSAGQASGPTGTTPRVDSPPPARRARAPAPRPVWT